MKLTVRKIVMSGILGAVTIILGYTGWGFIPLPTGIHATIMHIPTILAGVLEGPVVGLITGLIFGVFSMLRPIPAFFADPMVSILPRLFIGITAYYAFTSTKKVNTILACVIAGVVGTATNTVLVLGMIGIKDYLPMEVIKTVALVNGIPEIIIGAILTVILVKGIQRIRGPEGSLPRDGSV